MLKLLLLRHGKATKNQQDNSDFERQLNKIGNTQINQVGFMLRARGMQVGQIISSGAVRTRQTSQIANYFLQVDAVSYDDDLYLADKTTILGKITKSAKRPVVLYVGHNNGISDFATYLTGLRMDMSTGHLIGLEFEGDDWAELSAGLCKVEFEIIPDVLIL